MRKNEFIRENCSSSELIQVYNNLFIDEIYPNFFVKDFFRTTFIDSVELISSLVRYLSMKFNDERVYFKSYDYREKSNCCYSVLKSNLNDLSNDKLFELSLYSLDEGLLIFGSSSEWVIYLGEDLYYEGKRDNITEFLFVFTKNDLTETIIELYKNKYPSLVKLTVELNKSYFKKIDKEENINCLNIFT